MATVPRTVGLGGRDVLRVGLGTNRLTSTSAHVEFIRRAVDAGLELIDTAYSYSGGDSEAAIGTAGVTARAIVATKGGYGGPGQGRPEILGQQIETSLRRLRTERIDLYYLHRVDPETPLEDSLGAIKERVDRGQIGLVGLSEVTVEQIQRGRQVVPFAAVQNHYNLGERKHDAVVDYCTREGIAFVPFFPLRGERPSGVDEIAGRRGATPAQITLAWLLRRSPAMLPIPGTLSLEHLRQNLAALDIALSDAEFDALS